jgi:phosphatidylserine/phosphatidylglycerophosphate/cardiolipin synthase-like enzyme
MDPKEMDAILARTLEDGKLSRGERQALTRLLEEAPQDERLRPLLRGRAFEAARAALDQPRAREVLAWLEDVLGLAAVDAASRTPGSAEAFFSPGTACVERIAALLGAARKTADICVFTITDDRISRAIAEAYRRGVRVRIVTDNEKAYDLGSDVEALARAGIPVAVDTSPFHMHHKFAVFDGRLLLTGSYNWTRGAAAENEENLVVTDDARLVSAFAREFERLWQKFSA